MASFTSINGHAGIGVEVTAGTAVTPTQFPFVTEMEIGDEATHLLPNHVTRAGGHQIGTPQQGQASYPVSLSGPLHFNRMGWLLLAFDAAIATTGPSGDDYTHVAEPGTPASFTVEERPSGDISTAKTVAGVKFSSLELAFPANDLASFKVEGIGMSSPSVATATVIAYPTQNEINGLNLTTLSLGSVDLSEIAEGATIKITQELEALYGAKTKNPVEIKYKDMREIEVTIPIRLPVAAWHDFQARHIATPNPTEDTFTLVATDPSTGETFSVVGRRARVAAPARAPLNASGDVTRVTLSLKCLATLGGSAAWTVTMVNTDASPIQT